MQQYFYEFIYAIAVTGEKRQLKICGYRLQNLPDDGNDRSKHVVRYIK